MMPDFLDDDPILDDGLPRFLELCDRLGIRATLFVVGRDLGRPRFRGLVAAAAAAILAQSFIPLRSFSDTPVAGEAGQCRLSCAQSYYFCLSGDGGDDCPATWGQCRAACDAPGVAGLAGG